MPRSLDPSSRLTFVLACDVNKPRETQPRIFARTLTLNQQRRLMLAMGQMKTANADEKIDAAINAAEVCLIGWENMNDPETGQPILFSRDTIGDVLSIDELIEVFNAVTSASVPGADDKKKSELLPS